MPNSTADALMPSEQMLAAIDALIARIESFKVNPDFDEFVTTRELRKPDFDLDDDKILELMIKTIAYSNQSRADLVDGLIKSGALAKAFQDYSVKHVVALTPQTVIDEHWKKLTVMRQKKKIRSMVECARFLACSQQQHGSFMKYLRNAGLPVRIESEQNISVFWEAFDRIRADFKKRRVPYFRNFISLCYLLMELGFDCTKPDSAVMAGAVTLGIVPEAPPRKKNPNQRDSHPESSLRKTVRTIQSYAVLRNKRTPVIDLYFLILGGQSGVRHLVQRKAVAPGPHT